MGSVNLMDSEITENVDGVVGMEERTWTCNIHNVLNARRADNSRSGIMKESIECRHFFFLKIGYKHNRTMGNITEEIIPIPPRSENGILKETTQTSNGNNSNVEVRFIHKSGYE